MSDGRDAASTEAQADFQSLLDAVLPFAEQTLGRYGEMYPFAAAIETTGEIRLLASAGTDDRPESEAVLAELRDGARKKASSFRAVAFVADVRGDGQDAIRVEAEHQDGSGIAMFLLYTRNRFTRRVKIGEMRLSSHSPVIWK